MKDITIRIDIYFVNGDYQDIYNPLSITFDNGLVSFLCRFGDYHGVYSFNMQDIKQIIYKD